VPSQTKRDNSSTSDQIRQHYEIEKALATRLRNSTRTERQHLYNSLYDEMFQRVAVNPQLLEKGSPEFISRILPRQLRFVARFLTKQSIFLELGPGDCSFAFAVAPMVKKSTRRTSPRKSPADPANQPTSSSSFPTGAVCRSRAIPSTLPIAIRSWNTCTLTMRWTS